jgi:hypothetical protein
MLSRALLARGWREGQRCQRRGCWCSGRADVRPGARTARRPRRHCLPDSGDGVPIGVPAEFVAVAAEIAGKLVGWMVVGKVLANVLQAIGQSIMIIVMACCVRSLGGIPGDFEQCSGAVCSFPGFCSRSPPGSLRNGCTISPGSTNSATPCSWLRRARHDGARRVAGCAHVPGRKRRRHAAVKGA